MNARKQRAALREVTDSLRAHMHTLIDLELFGSVDELARTIQTLERHHSELPRASKSEEAA
jgi:hypothetical protein